MDHFAVTVRIGDPDDHRTQEQVDWVLRLHVDSRCWSSVPGRDVRRGMPVIASHVGAGRGQFLLGVFTGEDIEIPWLRAPEHAAHVGYEVDWIDAVFEADPDDVPGASGRNLTWLSSEQFTAALRALRVVRRAAAGD